VIVRPTDDPANPGILLLQQVSAQPGDVALVFGTGYNPAVAAVAVITALSGGDLFPGQSTVPPLDLEALGPFEVQGFVGLWQWNIAIAVPNDFPADSLLLDVKFETGGTTNPVDIPVRIR